MPYGNLSWSDSGIQVEQILLPLHLWFRCVIAIFSIGKVTDVPVDSVSGGEFCCAQLMFLCAPQRFLLVMLCEVISVVLQSAGSSRPAPHWANKPDAKATIQLPAAPERGSVSRSEGSSPTAAGRKTSAWTGQISHAVLTGAVKSSQNAVSGSSASSRPSSAQGGS